MKNIDIKSLIKDNVMSADEILEYINGNIPYVGKDLSNVVLYKNYKEWKQILEKYPKSQIINTSRRKILFDKEMRSLVIPTNEGNFKGFQYSIQVKVLNYLLGTNITYQEIDLHDEKELWNEWTLRLINNCKNYSVSNITGTIVGSINNTYFRFSKYLNHPILCNLDGFYKSILSTVEFRKYLEYRLDLILAEEDLVLGRHQFDKTLFIDFQHIPLPSKMDYQKCVVAKDYIYDRPNRLAKLNSNENLIDYIKADYIYSLDRLNQTNSIDPVFQSENPIIVRDSLLSYQLINTGKEWLINFDWVSSSQINKALEIISGNFNITHFYNFGKCGYFGKRLKIGDLVKPISCKKYPGTGGEINFINNIRVGTECKNLTVDSPLLETRPGLVNEAKSFGYSSIEMELFYMLKALKPHSKKYICYYVSDTPLSNTKLSVRLDSLKPRLEVLEEIFNEIVKNHFIAQ